MFVKPHDVLPLLCVNVQTEMRFHLKQLLFPEVGVVQRSYFKSHFSLHVEAHRVV